MIRFERVFVFLCFFVFCFNFKKKFKSKKKGENGPFVTGDEQI